MRVAVVWNSDSTVVNSQCLHAPPSRVRASMKTTASTSSSYISADSGSDNAWKSARCRDVRASIVPRPQ